MLHMFRCERGSRKIERRPRKRSLLAVHCLAVMLCAASVALTGCGLGKIDHTVASTSVPGAAFKGQVHGGNFPVVGSTIQMWAVGVSSTQSQGYGTGSVSIMNPGVTVTTDSTGSFTLNTPSGGTDYTCTTDPSGNSSQVFITALGGNPGLTPAEGQTIYNNQLMLMAALGPCDGLGPQTFININEVTTIASVYALAPFASINPNGNGILVGTNIYNLQGLANAMSTVKNLVDTSTGTAYAVTPYYNGGTPLGTAANNNQPVPGPGAPVPLLNSSTVPQARINTLANMLVGCVNTPGFPQGGVDTDPSTGDCGSLFVAATPAANAPVNAKVAPIDTLQAALDIALNPGNNVGTLVGLAGGSAAFFTPNLTSTPNDLALALTYTSAGLGINSAGSVNVIPGGFAIDANSNIFVSASGSGSSHQMLAEFNNFGEPLTAPTTVDTTTTPATPHYGGFQSGNLPSVTLLGSTSSAFDQNGTLWLAGQNVATVYEVTTSGGLSAQNPISLGGGGIGGFAVDGNNDVWVAQNNAGLQAISGPAASASYHLGNQAMFSAPVFDSNGILWTGDFGNNGNVYAIDVLGVTGATPGTQLVNSTSDGGAGSPLAADNQGNVYGINFNVNAVDVWTANSTNPHPNNAIGKYTFSGLGGSPLADGLSHMWFTIFGGALVDTVGISGTLLSPATGYTGTGATVTGGNTEAPVTGNTVPGIAAFDSSGNLWMVNSGGGGSDNMLVEFVGLGAPVATPTAAGVAGTRP